MIQEGLPEELVGEITSHIQADYGTLKACSLTCKRLNQVVRPHLYRSVVVNRRQRHQTLSKDLPILNFPGYKPAYTTHLVIESSQLLPDDVVVLFQELPFDRFSHVRTLTLSRVDLPISHAVPPSTDFTKKITSLRLDNVSYLDVSDALYFILSFPELRCLEIHPEARPGVSGTLSDQEVGPKESIPPLDCLHFRLDINPHLPLALILSPMRAKPTRRLQVVTGFTKAECFSFGGLLQEVIHTLETLTLGLVPTEKTQIHIFVIFQLSQPFLRLHTLTLSHLDFSEPHYVPAHYALFCLLFNNIVTSPDQPLKRVTLSFRPQTTSREDILRSMSTDSPKNKLDMIRLVPESKLSALFEPYERVLSSEASDEPTGLKHIWEAIDSRLGDPVALPQLGDVLVQIRALTRATSSMKVDDFKEFVAGLLPICEGRGVLRVEVGVMELDGGIWEIHDFNE